MSGKMIVAGVMATIYRILAGIVATSWLCCVAPMTMAGQIVVAVMAPLSGPYHDIGLQMRNAAESAVAEINDHRTKFNAYRLKLPEEDRGRALDMLVLQVADDKCEYDRGMTFANQAANQGIPLIIGDYCSWISAPAATLYAQMGLVHILPFSTVPPGIAIPQPTADPRDPADQLNPPTLFRLTSPVESQAAKFIELVTTYFPQESDIGVLTDNSPVGCALGAAIVDGLDALAKDTTLPLPLVNKVVRATFPLTGTGTAGACEATGDKLNPQQKQKAIAAALQAMQSSDVVFIAGYHLMTEPPLMSAVAGSDGVVAVSDINLARLYETTFTPVDHRGPLFLIRPIASLPTGSDLPQLFTRVALKVWADAEERMPVSDPWSVNRSLISSGHFATEIGDLSFDKFGYSTVETTLKVWSAGTLTSFVPRCPPLCEPGEVPN